MNMDRKKFNLVVLVDFKNAFDNVDHVILLMKLEMYGIKGPALSLLRLYLANRTQKCQINGSTLSERIIKCGVPQGSILGPLLFLVYINDLPNCLNRANPQLSADDTNLTATGESISDVEMAMNSDLEDLRKWLIANKLSLKVAKTEFILIGSRPTLTQISNEHPKVSIGNKSIKQAKQCKMLRVKIDQDLTWKSNTENICKKVNSGIFALRSLKPLVDKDSLLSVYNSIVRPYFNYCSEVWDVFGDRSARSKTDQLSHNEYV